MKVVIAFGVMLIAGLTIIGVEPIDAGHVGVKINLIGTGKGVDNTTEVTGWVFYNRFTEKVVEFPTFIRHKEYKTTVEDGKVTSDESFVIKHLLKDIKANNSPKVVRSLKSYPFSGH